MPPADDFGRRAATDVTNVWEFYATVMHLLGFDFNRLAWYHNGCKLTDVHGRVIQEVLA